MFSIVKTPTYYWPVKVQIAIDGGRFKEETFEAQFNRLPQSRVVELMDRAESGAIKDVDLLTELVAGWRGVKDENGNEVEFSISNLSLLIDIPGVAHALFEAWKDSRIGAKRKN